MHSWEVVETGFGLKCVQLWGTQIQLEVVAVGHVEGAEIFGNVYLLLHREQTEVM